jgi:hypothetical protein
LRVKVNDSTLLENTDFENERPEIPPKANTAKCIHCGKSLQKRTLHSLKVDLKIQMASEINVLKKAQIIQK